MNETEFAREMSGREQQLKGKKWAEGGAATDGRGWRHVIKSVGALSGSRGRPQGQDTSWRCHFGGWETEGAATERNGRCGVKRPDQMSSKQAASFSGAAIRFPLGCRFSLLSTCLLAMQRRVPPGGLAVGIVIIRRSGQRSTRKNATAGSN